MTVERFEKFNVEYRYKHITVNARHWDKLQQIEDWCRNPDNGIFLVYASGIQYHTDKDLTAFVLRWA